MKLFLRIRHLFEPQRTILRPEASGCIDLPQIWQDSLMGNGLYYPIERKYLPVLAIRSKTGSYQIESIRESTKITEFTDWHPFLKRF